MGKQYYETSEVVEMTGWSATTARKVMQSMPHLRIAQGKKGSIVRVKIEDFERYIDEHTIQPDEMQPRSTPYSTVEAETKAYQAQRAGR